MRDTGKIFVKGLLMLLAGVFIGTLLLVLAYMVPVNMENRDDSYAALDKEGWYPRAFISSKSYDTYFTSFYPDVLDGSSDMIMIYTALDDSEGSPLIKAMRSYNQNMGEYPRYWHGYVSVLRPLLFFFNYSELRILNSIGQLLVIILLAMLVYREKGLRYVLMLITSYVLLSPFTLAMGLQFTWVFYIAYIGTVILLKRRDFFLQNNRYVLFFMALGIMTSYFDLLTYPLVTWGIPLLWWIIMSDQMEVPGGYWVRQVIYTGIAWVAGYALMWIAKWELTTLVLGYDVFGQAFDQVLVRAGADRQDAYSLSARLQAIYFNWKHYQYKIYAIVLILWLVWWLYQTWRQGGWRGDTKRRAYLLVGFSSIVWYFVLANHTQGHHFFAYRNFAVSILAFLAIILSGISDQRPKYRISIKRSIPVGSLYLITAVFAVILTMLAKEDFNVTNGIEVFRQIPLENGDKFEVDFKPSFDEIHDVRLGLECGGQKGNCIVSVWDGDTLKYQESCPVENFEDNYQSIEVRWKLDRSKTYRMIMQVEGVDRTVYLWVTENGATPMSEYGELYVNGNPESGQVLTGITYWAMPASRSAKVFLVMTWVGVILSCFCALCPYRQQYGNFASDSPQDSGYRSLILRVFHLR